MLIGAIAGFVLKEPSDESRRDFFRIVGECCLTNVETRSSFLIEGDDFPLNEPLPNDEPNVPRRDLLLPPSVSPSSPGDTASISTRPFGRKLSMRFGLRAGCLGSFSSAGALAAGSKVTGIVRSRERPRRQQPHSGKCL